MVWRLHTPFVLGECHRHAARFLVPPPGTSVDNGDLRQVTLGLNLPIWPAGVPAVGQDARLFSVVDCAPESTSVPDPGPWGAAPQTGCVGSQV